MQVLSYRNHETGRALMKESSIRNEQVPSKMDTDEKQLESELEIEQDTIVWEEPGRLSRLLLFPNWKWCFSFCPRNKAPCDSVSITLDEHSESSDDEQPEQPHLTTIDNLVPVIRQPPPVQVQTTWSEASGYPTIVYIYNLPKNRPSVVHLSDRITSIDTLTVSGDEEDDDDDYSSEDEEIPPPPPPIYRDAPPRPPLHASSSNNMPRPPLVASRTLTFGSCTTNSSRHRRSLQTVSPQDLKSVYEDDDDDDTLSSEASPFPQLLDSSQDSGVVVAISPKSKQRHSPPPELVHIASETTLDENDAWMKEWVNGAGTTTTLLAECRDDDEPQEIHVPSHAAVESTYLPRCPWLEHVFGNKILFAGWLVYIPADRGCSMNEQGALPSRRDVVYLMLLRDVPKLYLARDDSEIMTTVDVTSKMRVSLRDISKSHGRGVVVTDNGVDVGALLPISLASYMFEKHSLVPENEFQALAHRTIAPFARRRNDSKEKGWHDVEHHQDYAPVAQLEAAMHLMFVMDSWMTKMLRTR